jgi:hypothetical protein
MDRRLKPYCYLWKKTPKSIKLAFKVIIVIGLLVRLAEAVKYFAGF